MTTRRDLVFNPKDFIRPPFRHCPHCGKDEYGFLMISGYTITRRCRACWHTASEALPRLTKKVIYLDQFVYSNIAKALDPVWSTKRGPQDPFWTALFDALDRAVRLQLIVCPTSTIHEKESATSPEPAILRELYEHLAAGTSFQYPAHVLFLQWAHGLRASLRGEVPDYTRLERAGVLHGSLDRWMDRIRISVRASALDPDPARERVARGRSHDALAEWQHRWKVEGHSFDEVYQFERRGFPHTVWEAAREHAALMIRAERGEVPPDQEDIWNPRLEALTVPNLCQIAREAGIPEDGALIKVAEFLNSASGQDAPANDLSALLLASLARKARAGQERLPSQGMWNDILAISHYLPYCDAMFVDNECAGLLAEEPIRTRTRAYGRVFSLNTRDEFLAYLRESEHAAGPEHLQRVIEVYGAEWLAPFREVLSVGRERLARADTSSTPKPPS